MVTCSTCEHAIWLFDELTPPEQEQVRQHIEGCMACRQVWQQRQAYVKLLPKSAPLPRHAAALTQRVMQALPRTHPTQRVSSIWRLALHGCALVLMVFFLWEHAVLQHPVTPYHRSPLSGVEAPPLSKRFFARSQDNAHKWYTKWKEQKMAQR